MFLARFDEGINGVHPGVRTLAWWMIRSIIAAATTWSAEYVSPAGETADWVLRSASNVRCGLRPERRSLSAPCAQLPARAGSGPALGAHPVCERQATNYATASPCPENRDQGASARIRALARSTPTMLWPALSLRLAIPDPSNDNSAPASRQRCCSGRTHPSLSALALSVLDRQRRVESSTRART